MAVFKQELNWSTYQDKQMDVLKSIEKSLSSNLKISQSLYGNMDKIEYAITSIAYASEASARNLASITKDLIGQATEFHSRMDKASESTRRLTKNIDSVASSTYELREEIDATRLSISSLADRLVDRLGDIGQRANEFSEASNQMIRLSGMTGETVREFRSEILSIVRDLNVDTGSAFSPMDSYQHLISISQGVTSNLDAIEEMARPLLLTQEALDVNINSVATLFNRFYTRYTFSSEHMEDALDHIRGNTAGNAANAEATMHNIDALKGLIDNTAGNDNELREQLLKQISNYTAWIESMEMDSNIFTEYMKNIGYSDWTTNPELIRILGRAGMNSYDATNLVSSGEYEQVTKAIMDGVYNMMQTFDTDRNGSIENAESYALGPALDALGVDRDFAMEVWNAKNSQNFKSIEDFILDQASKPRMEELVEDKYYSLATKANNWLENIYGVMASIQEYLPFGFSDIAMALLAFRGMFGTFSGGGVGNFLGTAKNYAVSSAAGGIMSTHVMSAAHPSLGIMNSASGALGKAAALGGGLGGVAMLSGGVLAGGALAYDGLNGMFNEENSTDAKVLSGLEAAGGIGGTAALIGLGITNPIGWIALAIGGAALLGKNLNEAATKIGESRAIEDAYDNAAKAITDKSRANEDILLDIKSGLEHEEDLEEMKRRLIDSNILSENDRKKVINSNKEALISLTDAYLKATEKFTPDYEIALDEYERADKEYAEELKKSMVSALQEWNDRGKLKTGSDELASTDTLFYSIYKGLQDQQAEGIKFDKDTQKTYDNLVKIYESGDRKLSAKEANMVIDEGWFNTTLLNSNLGVENIITAANKMAAKNEAGKEFYDRILPEGTYYGSEEASHVLELAYKALHATNAESATEYLDALKKEGFSSQKYKEIGEAAEKWGLKGYAEGTNYIDKDQIALVHAGEAITPKKYNPMANKNELESLREYFEKSQKEKDSQEESLLSTVSKKIENLRMNFEEMPTRISQMIKEKSLLRDIESTFFSTSVDKRADVVDSEESRVSDPRDREELSDNYKYKTAVNEEVADLQKQYRLNQESVSSELKQSREYMRQTMETLGEIREFLSYWREDSIKRETAKETKSRFLTSSKFLSSYTLEST